jgi:hypothetical protein
MNLGRNAEQRVAGKARCSYRTRTEFRAVIRRHAEGMAWIFLEMYEEHCKTSE